MNASPDETLAEDARLWAIRVRDPAFTNWDGFTAWLEADPARNAAYEAALHDLDRADGLFDVAPAPEPAWQPVDSRYRARARWRVPAMAAGVAALAMAGGWLALDRDAVQEYATAPGERQIVQLADGSRIMLNGGTRLTMDSSYPRAVTMADGEALFQVRHDAREPFVVTMANGTRLVDVGTTFNVVEQDGALSVAVSEGAVIYRSGATEVRLDAGEMLSRAGATAEPRKRAVDPGTVGSWQTGYLQFADTSLQEVASDLSRNLGSPVTVDPRLATQRFSGTIMLDGGAAAVMARVGALLNVRPERRGEGWMMIPADGARR